MIDPFTIHFNNYPTAISLLKGSFIFDLLKKSLIGGFGLSDTSSNELGIDKNVVTSTKKTLNTESVRIREYFS